MKRNLGRVLVLAVTLVISANGMAASLAARDQDESEAENAVVGLVGEMRDPNLEKNRIRKLLRGYYKKDQETLLSNPIYREKVRRFNERIRSAQVSKIRRYSETRWLVFVHYNMNDDSSDDIIYMVESSPEGKKIVGEVEDYLVCDRDKKGRSRLCD